MSSEDDSGQDQGESQVVIEIFARFLHFDTMWPCPHLIKSNDKDEITEIEEESKWSRGHNLIPLSKSISVSLD